MFWNKKKKERGLPDLPPEPKAIPSMKDYKRPIPKMDETHPLESLPSHEKFDEEEIHGLPTFPDSPMKKGFSQTIIKDAVETEDIKDDLPELPKIPDKQEMGKPAMNKPRLIEMEEWKPKEQKPIHLQEPPKIAPKKTISDKPIFVRVDKFRTARESLETVKDKLKDIDELLRTIREVKMKEDHELSSWEKEIEAIKARINTVTTEIFDSSYTE